ncbi:alpha/beta fold hydrolase [Roseococcus sp. YIM B11640]|uniref:alpha/beta fold hydrolase n=1 Tax=Roseococcus sp. YIM B11640 TaxID=3133973 RepID=UPI003C7CFC47
MPSFEVDGYPISYAEAGIGEPLVMIHGTLGDQRSFAPQMEAFAAKYRVLSLSMRHTWPGNWQEGGNFTIARHVEDVAGFIRGMGLGKVRLLGHSRGGHISFRIGEKYPELVRALVLAEPGGELDETLGGVPASGQQAANFATAAQKIAAGDIEGGLSEVAERTGGPGAWGRRAEHRKAINRDNARTLLGQMHEDRKPYTRAAAEAVDIPTLLIGGEKSQPSFGKIMDALERTMPRTERVTVPNGTHGLNHDNPEFFNKAVLDFLARH